MRRAAIVLAIAALPVVAAIPSSLGDAQQSTSVVRAPSSRPTAVPGHPCRTTAVAAGDFDGTAAQIAATGSTAVAQNPDVALLLGDIAYPSGTTAEIKAGIAAGPWKSLFAIAKPTPGNHDYQTAGAADYFSYFAPPGPSYAFDLGCGWRGYSLDSEVSLTSQVTWLKNDLAAHPDALVVAIWHKPRFSSGVHGDNTTMAPLWNALAGRKGVVLNGHDHDYERFKASNGLQEFVVGTGGSAGRSWGSKVSAGSQVRIAGKPGVLRLTLMVNGYWWSFVDTKGNILDLGGTPPLT